VLETLGGFDEKRRRAMASAARARVLAEHTGERRAAQLDALLELPAASAARLRHESRRAQPTRDVRL